jgi:phage shock protein A
MEKAKAKWQEQKGVRADIAAVEFYAPEIRAKRWLKDARKLGKSRSKYLQELISAGEELFKVEQEPINYAATDDAKKLHTRIKSLELQLIQERQRTAQLNVTLEGVTDEMILETLTSKKFTDTDTIIQSIINQHFGGMIIQPIMAALYRLAEQDQVEYSRKINGWKLKV